MNGKLGALVFLILRTSKNRLARQVARAKSPRYLLAVILGLAYFWFAFFRPTFTHGPSSAEVDAVGVSMRSTVGSIAGIGMVVTVTLWWLLGGVANALAYQPAEMQMLFTAPLSRRALLGYKIGRTQVQLVFGSLIWAFLIRRWGVSVAAPLRFATAWGFLSLMSLHRLGAALVQNPPVTGPRRLALWTGKILAAGAVLAILMGVVPPFLHVTADTLPDAFVTAGRALNAPPASYALAPFQMILAPLYAGSPLAWARAFGLVAGAVALHVVWVLWLSSVEFEEAAATATADMAKRLAAFRERRAMGGVIQKPSGKARQWLPLKPAGRPAIAVVWKNTLALVRTGVLRSVLMVIVILVVGASVARTAKSDKWSGAMAVSIGGLAVMLLVLGPRTVRNDLRQDLLNLPLLKTYPLSGATMVAAQMASPVLLLSLFELGLCMVGWWSAPLALRKAAIDLNMIAAVLLIPAVIIVFNGIAIGIQNGAALVFPAWVRLGGQAGGVEVIGQSILVTMGSLLAQALLMVIPAVVGIGIYFGTRHALGPSAFLAAGAGGVVILAAELVAFVLALGEVFNKLDPNALSPV